MMEVPVSLALPNTSAFSLPEKPPPSDALSRNFAAFLQSTVLGQQENEETVEMKPSLLPFISLSQQNHRSSPEKQMDGEDLSRNFAAFLHSSLTKKEVEEDCEPTERNSVLRSPFVPVSPHKQPPPSLYNDIVQRHPELHAALQSSQTAVSTSCTSPSLSTPSAGGGAVQQIAQSDIVTVQPRKPPSAGGRGTVGLAVHVDGYLYHGKKTRLDGTKLLYCLDRTKYNCMAVAELFPNGTFRAKRPHTGHLPNPEECEVRLAKRLMRERAREHPEYTSKEIIRDICADPTLSEEAKQRLTNYTSLRKFVARGRHSSRKEVSPMKTLENPMPTPVEENHIATFGIQAAELAALISQVAAATASSTSSAIPTSLHSPFSPSPLSSLPTATVTSFPSASSEDLARLVRELQQAHSANQKLFLSQNGTVAPINNNNVIEPATLNFSETVCSAASCSSSSSSGNVWHTIDVEVIDFTRMPDGPFSYIFHAKDTVSRFSHAQPMADKSVTCLLNAIKSLFYAYGPCHVIRVDECYAELSSELQASFPLTTVEYIVQRKTNSGVLIPRREASMMKERIFAWLMETGKKEWAKALSEIKYGHNTEWIEEIECTPLEKFFGRSFPAINSSSSRFSTDENNESHDGMSEDGEEAAHSGDLFDLSPDQDPL